MKFEKFLNEKLKTYGIRAWMSRLDYINSLKKEIDRLSNKYNLTPSGISRDKDQITVAYRSDSKPDLIKFQKDLIKLDVSCSDIYQ